jgi:hypothetical protein
VLDPPDPLSAIETRRVLESVRAGAALLYVMTSRGPMEDSLHVKRTFFGGIYEPTEAGTADVPDTSRTSAAAPAPDVLDTAADVQDTTVADSASADEEEEEPGPSDCGKNDPTGGALPLWADRAVHLWQLQWTRPAPARVVTFARAGMNPQGRDTLLRQSWPTAVGFPLGRGRVVVIADADLLRNDALRVCQWGLDVVAVRMLEYLRDGGKSPRKRLVFDEYHQGFGAHPGTIRAIATYLVHVPSGHVLVQAFLAGLVLLLALGPRGLPPRDPERVERRSPLEHVTALAQAYANVSATRTATQRLLHGVRRRVEHGALGPASVRSGGDGRGRAADDDEGFLQAAVREDATLASYVELVRRALATPVSRRELEEVGAALGRIEASLLSLRR